MPYLIKSHTYQSITLDAKLSTISWIESTIHCWILYFSKTHCSQKNHCNDNCNNFSDYNDIIAPLDKLIMLHCAKHWANSKSLVQNPGAPNTRRSERQLYKCTIVLIIEQKPPPKPRSTKHQDERQSYKGARSVRPFCRRSWSREGLRSTSLLFQKKTLRCKILRTLWIWKVAVITNFVNSEWKWTFVDQEMDVPVRTAVNQWKGIFITQICKFAK